MLKFSAENIKVTR